MLWFLACSASSSNGNLTDTADTGLGHCTTGTDVGQCAPDVTLYDVTATATALLSHRGSSATLIDSEAPW